MCYTIIVKRKGDKKMKYHVIYGNWEGYQGEVEQVFDSYDEAFEYADQWLFLDPDEWFEVEERED